MISISRPAIEKEEINAVVRVLKSGRIAQGENVKKFEKQFSNFIGAKYAVATSSGTNALFLALLAHGLKRGDEVITTPFSFIASSDAIRFVGASPVFVDINPYSFNVDPALIEEKISAKTKAILIVHIFGNPCEMEKIMKIVNRHHLILIEDSCQAHGAELKGKKVGSFGTGCFSFYATKNMTTGEGGMVTTNNKALAEKIRLLRQHGSKVSYYSKVLGYNFCMTDFQAAMGLEQLKKLVEHNEKRINNARYMTAGLGQVEGIILPTVCFNTKHVFHQYTIRVVDKFPTKRDEVLKVLKNKGIDGRVYYPIPIYKQKSYKSFGYKYKLSQVERIVKEVISLPVHPLVKKSELDYIIQTIKRTAVCNRP
ncbi:aminotransferase DegT [Candidatus Woesebacteria bacterium RIFOXYA1_FULL_40_18]|uniref:Aminotransferase DegT n=2 Tax=Candidatus Woeseibacteriota TaxID=1752722 RepID=A0A1F8CJN5_9BACT|nr:MAG: putative pyridoxal phosphate-dependent enzyme [Candidatus Woesebacteria bacterium GW2011_GWA1_40_45]OGM76444.1 MAG: aminotransferase DegT [Candidatus Woesebacteria bacterium RIFOXYA1_FULL_40_18]